MPRLDANLNFLFTEVAFLDRFAAARQAGFHAVEYPFPYDYDKQKIAARLRDNALTMALINLPPGDWRAGDRGMACDPARVGEFRATVDLAIEFAETLGCKRANCLAGLGPDSVDDRALHTTFVDNVAYAAKQLGDAGLDLLIEPINTQDVPGFYLSRSDQALEIIAEIDVPNLQLQFDVYHMQIMQGNIVATLEACIAQIGHVQIADNPGRHEPGTGELNFPIILSALDRLGYDGWVGCEYAPLGTTLEGLAWAEHYL